MPWWILWTTTWSMAVTESCKKKLVSRCWSRSQTKLCSASSPTWQSTTRRAQSSSRSSSKYSKAQKFLTSTSKRSSKESLSVWVVAIRHLSSPAWRDICCRCSCQLCTTTQVPLSNSWKWKESRRTLSLRSWGLKRITRIIMIKSALLLVSLRYWLS